MKTILFVGDSWGVPNYHGPDHGPSPETHSEFLLKNLGYKVYNCSFCGGKNVDSMLAAEKFLSGEPIQLEPIGCDTSLYQPSIPTIIYEANPKIDWIVWFHTESLRYRFDTKLTLRDNLIWGYTEEYIHARAFFKKIGAKVAVIGGQAPIFRETFDRYIQPDFLIEDWRSEIVGRKLPESYWTTKSMWVETSNDFTVDKIKYANTSLEIFDAMKDSEDFPDNCHPGAGPHKILSDRLHQVFQD